MLLYLGGLMELTGDLIEAYQRDYLEVKCLNEWALSLLESGFEGEAVLTAASCPDLSWQDVRFYFNKILKELKIADDLDQNIEAIKQQVFLDEYKKGLRLGSELLYKFDSLRKQVGFYDMVGFTIIGDDYKGECKVGYHTLDRKLYGEDLEKEIRAHLKKACRI
jgi:hypothetical protein